MLGSAFINHRHNVGLQHLSALAGISHSSLGPNKKYKFIQDDRSGESTLVCSCFRILENLDLTSAVGQLVYETNQAHHKVYHTGSGCLLFLAGAWSCAALACLERGISIAHIISAMSEGLEICTDVFRKSSFSTEGLGMGQSETCAATSHGSGLHLPKNAMVKASQASAQPRQTTECDHRTLNGLTQRKVKLSRHFYEARFETASTVLPPYQPKHPNIPHIAEGLSHGCFDAMNLVVEVSRMQTKTFQKDINCPMFDVNKVVTCVLPGLLEENACVLPGCIVLLSADQASIAHHLKEEHLKVALINGDLSDTYRHLGYKKPKGIKRVNNLSDLSHASKEEEWMEKVVALLLKLEVQLVLVSGLVSEQVILHCCIHHILVVQRLKVSILKAFAEATGAVPVTYATQLTKHCVGVGVKVVIWRDLSSYDGKLLTTVNISVDGNSELVTVILTSCVHAKLQALEDQFWACAYRLYHTLKDKVLLPGAGVTEILCVQQLKKEAGQDVRHPRERSEDCVQTAGRAPNPHRGLVLHLMADGLIDYVSTILVNTGRFSYFRARTAVSQHLQDCNESGGIAANFPQLFLEFEQDPFLCTMKSSDPPTVKIYDNLTVKQEAWRKALDLVLLVLQTDAEVITGFDQKSDAAPENLMLL